MCVSHNCHIISGSGCARFPNCNYFIQTTRRALPLNILFQAPPRHVHAACPESPETPFARVSYGFSCSVSVSLLLSARHHLQYTCNTYLHKARCAAWARRATAERPGHALAA